MTTQRKASAPQLEKLSSTHRNVSSALKASTSKKMTAVSNLRLDKSRNPVVRAVPLRVGQVVSKVDTRSKTIDRRSTELKKKADYVRQESSKQSNQKKPSSAPTKKTTAPRPNVPVKRAPASPVKKLTVPATRRKAEFAKTSQSIAKANAGSSTLAKRKTYAPRVVLRTANTTEKKGTVVFGPGKGKPVQTTQTRKRYVPGNSIKKPIRINTTTTRNGGTPTYTRPSTSPKVDKTVTVVRAGLPDWEIVKRGKKPGGVSVTGKLSAKGGYKHGEGVAGDATAGIEGRANYQRGGRLAGVDVGATAFVGAKAGGALQGSVSKRRGAHVKVQGKVLLGGEATVNASGRFSGLKGGATVGVSYGLGAEGGVEARLSPTRVKFKAKAGVTFGLGFKAGVDVDIDLKKIRDDATYYRNKAIKVLTPRRLLPRIPKLPGLPGLPSIPKLPNIPNPFRWPPVVR